MFIFLIVLGLYFILNLVVQLNSAGVGHFDVLSMLKYVLMTLPMNCYVIFPMVSLLGSLIGLGLLASHNEITVMRSAGMSVTQIVGSVLVAALILTVAAAAIGEGVGPSLAVAAEKMKVLESSAGHAIETHQGVWLRSDNHFIHIDAAYLSKHLVEGVTDYQFAPNSTRLLQVEYAKDALYQDHHWMLRNISTTKILPTQVTVTHTKEKAWPVEINNHLFNFFNIGPSEMSLGQLHNFLHYQAKSGNTMLKYRLIYWRRVFFPLTIIIMIFMAVPFMFGSFRHILLGFRVMLGVGIALVYFFLSKLLQTFSLTLSFPPALAALLPFLFFSAVAVLLMKRVS